MPTRSHRIGLLITDLYGQRYSPLTQITPTNAAGLKPLWTYQIKQMDHFETTPIAVDGVLYITEPPDTVSALDARTGRSLCVMFGP